LSGETITLYFNYDAMVGCDQVEDDEGEVVRGKLIGVSELGLMIKPRPATGFVHYLPCEIKATKSLLGRALHPNGTTLIEIQLRRVVRKSVFTLERMKKQFEPKSFKGTKPGDGLAY
jgi:hypothetical protein